MMEFSTPLCEIAYCYKTDKCPQVGNAYTPFYHAMLKGRRETIRKVVELGIGAASQIGRKIPGYRTGASLLMWRDYFPNAQVFGADYRPEAMVQGEERITTLVLDERRPSHLHRLIKATGQDVDLFIDDAIHQGKVQISTCLFLMPMMKADVIYVIEDVLLPDEVAEAIRGRGYECRIFTTGKRHANLAIVRNR